MAIASTLTPETVISGNLRVSSASVDDVAFYDRSAYRRMDQLTKGDQDSLLTNTLFPKATIELLIMLEVSWWPNFAATKGLNSRTLNGSKKAVTAFDTTKIIKQNQTMIQLEVYKATEIFYSTLVTDNANVNEKDAANYEFAAKRFQEEWNKARTLSDFYDVDSDSVVDKSEENTDSDPAYFDGDRRYF